MSSVQERLQLKRVPLDTWNIREKLFLASAVVRSGDQNWMSVSRALKTMGEPNRPPDWYSQKSCAAQYGALLEHVETPKRKKRNSEGAVETPQESILKRLMQQRVLEIQENLKEMEKQYDQIKNEITELRSPSTPDERIQELWTEIETAKRLRERENARRAAWLKEREERRARAERPWRPSQTPPPTTPTTAPPSSPLLTSLLKSSPVVTTPQHIPHPATVVDSVSPSAGAPTLSLLLEQPHAQESKHAAIEHIKSQLVQIEHQLKASSQSGVPAVDIDDIEIKAEDVYAFRDIDIHIPPVALHKGTVRITEKPVSKKEDEVAPEPEMMEAVVEDIKEEPTAEESVPEESFTTTNIQTVEEPQIEETQEIQEEMEPKPQQQPQPEAEVKIVFPEVKFPTPEIKVIQPDEQKIKEETKEPETVQVEKIIEEKEETPPIEERVEEPTPITEEEPKQTIVEENNQEVTAVPEPKPEPEPEQETIVAQPEVPDPQDIPLPEEEVKEEEKEAEKPVPEEEQQPEVVKHEEDIKKEEEPEVKEEVKEEEIVEEKKEETIEEKVDEDSKKGGDEDAEDSIPLKEMMREELSEVKREEVVEEDTHTETDDDTPMELSREEEKDGKKKRDYSRKKKSDSRTCSGSESAPESPSGSDAERQHRLWRKSVMLVYSRLCAHKYASLFLRPITDEEAPGYSAVVRRPQDLAHIRRDIDAGHIRTTAQFQRAVLLMLSNALMYNSSSHSVYSMAKEMHEEAQCQLNMLVAAQAHAGLCAPRRKRRRYALD
ncbi:unnamed protein product, partial [Brenthis ino]